MDYNEIRKLLEKYWAAATDVSEEMVLKNFFLNHTDIPADLLTEKKMFLTFHKELTYPELNEDLSARLRRRLRKNTIPFWKTAMKYAAVLLVISIAAYFIFQNKSNKQRSLVIEETIKDKKEAVKEVNTALLMLSLNMKDGLENVKQLEILKELGNDINDKQSKKIIR